MTQAPIQTPKLNRREQLGVESRRRIIDAAGVLMSERGYAGTSIAAVSEQSGLPSGSIYWHFENKEALLGAVLEDGVERWLEALPEPGAGSPKQLDAMLDKAATSLEEHPQFLRLLFLIALERRKADAASIRAIQRARETAMGRIHKALAPILAPLGVEAASFSREAGALFLSVADGAMLAHMIDPDETNLRGQFQLLHLALSALVGRMTDERNLANG